MEMYRFPKLLCGKLHGHCLTEASEGTHPTGVPNRPVSHHFFKSLWVEGRKES